MLSDIVDSGACQKCRTTKGGTMATQATTIHFGTVVIPITIAPTQTAITHATESSVLMCSEGMRRV